MDSKFWNGLLEWIKSMMIQEGTVSPSDLEIFRVVDTPEEAVAIIKRRVIV